MLNVKLIEKRADLIDRIVASVAEYYATFGEAMPMKALSAKYGKALKNCGGFEQTIGTLFQDGTFEIILMRSGGKAVYPGGTLCVLNAEEAKLLKRG